MSATELAAILLAVTVVAAASGYRSHASTPANHARTALPARPPARPHARTHAQKHPP